VPGKLVGVLMAGMLIFFVGGTVIGVTPLRNLFGAGAGPAIAVAPAPAAPAAPAPPTAAPAKPAAQPAAAQPAAPAPPTAAPAKNLPRLPQPQMAAPLNRTAPATVKLEIETKEITATMADGVTYTYWTFNGTVPGPMLRVMQGDTIEVTLTNAKDSTVAHSIDFHSVTGPGGGAKATQTMPGGRTSFTWKALNPGVYIYHCATPMVAHHIANGMYGLIVVEPVGGLPKVDREFYVVQGDFYLQGKRGDLGHRSFSVDKMLDERPDFVVFNGSAGALTGENALKARVGETVRIYFGVGGPNLTSSFHVIGEIFDRVYPEGAGQPLTNVQTTLVPAGGATIVEFTVEVPGTYVLVDHSLGRLEKGGAAQLIVEGPENPEIFKAPPATGAVAQGGH
jgi:nitrite reductase (NO-forming)